MQGGGGHVWGACWGGEELYKPSVERKKLTVPNKETHVVWLQSFKCFKIKLEVQLIQRKMLIIHA